MKISAHNENKKCVCLCGHYVQIKKIATCITAESRCHFNENAFAVDVERTDLC